MVFLRKAGYRSKCRKDLLWFAVGWDFSVELLESVGFNESCFTVAEWIFRACCGTISPEWVAQI